MALVLNDDQQMLAETARTLADRESPVERVRALRDGEAGLGYSRELWRQMAELGLAGIPFPEAMGGLGLGLADLAVVLEALGRNLAPEPFLSTVLLAGQALLRGGSEDQRAAWLPRLTAGEVVLALAHQERSGRYTRTHITTRAERVGDEIALSGEKVQVFDADGADALVVAARTSGKVADEHGVTLVLVPAGADGLRIERQTRVDGRNAATIVLDGVTVGADAVVGEVDGGAPLLENVLDLASIGLGAEMLGGMSAAFERTMAYLKERSQFGVPIGSFQALKHRAARLFADIEMCRSVVMAAARAADGRSADLPAMASLVKAKCGETFLHVAEEAIQMYGGIGMTDEHEIGFYLKRARAADVAFGDASWHRDRWARLQGY